MESPTKLYSFLVLLPESYDITEHNTLNESEKSAVETGKLISKFYDNEIRQVSWYDSAEIVNFMRKQFCNETKPTEFKLHTVQPDTLTRILDLCKEIKRLSRLPPSLINKIELLIPVDDKKYNTYLYAEFNYTEKIISELLNEFKNHPTAKIYYYESTMIGE